MRKCRDTFHAHCFRIKMCVWAGCQLLLKIPWKSIELCLRMCRDRQTDHTDAIVLNVSVIENISLCTKISYIFLKIYWYLNSLRHPYISEPNYPGLMYVFWLFMLWMWPILAIKDMIRYLKTEPIIFWPPKNAFTEEISNFRSKLSFLNYTPNSID